MVALVGGPLDDQGKQADRQLSWLNAAPHHAQVMS
jgi:hypothetical protein